MDLSPEILILAAVIGLIPATIAKTKGYSFFVWWLYGAAFFILALPHAIIMSRDTKVLEDRLLAEGMQKCPGCAELIKAEARRCRYCQADLPSPPPVA